MGGLPSRTKISIHAPREGGDCNSYDTLRTMDEFQSTPPARGATAHAGATIAVGNKFQSTPPARGAT